MTLQFFIKVDTSSDGLDVNYSYGTQNDYGWCMRCAFCTTCRHKRIILYDEQNFIIGQTDQFCEAFVADAYYKLYRYYFHPQSQLTQTDVYRHIPPGQDSTTIYIEIECAATATTHKDVITTSCINMAQVLGTTDLTFEVIDSVQVKLNKVQVAVLMTTSEFFYNLLQKYCSTKDVVKLTDVDAELFQRLVEFLHFGQSVYIKTESGKTLQECSREMLVLSNRFMMADFSEVCARAVVDGTTKDNVCSDIQLLMTHYQGDNKSELMVDIGRKLKDLQPDGMSTSMREICDTSPELAAAMLGKLFRLLH